MILPDFTLHQPETLNEALQLAGELGDKADFIAGGTDLLPNYKHQLNNKPHLISLQNVKEIKHINEFSIGATATLNELEQSGPFSIRFPIFRNICQMVATPLIRTRATVAGNLLVNTRCIYFNQSPFWHKARGYCMKIGGDNCTVIPGKNLCYAVYCGDLAPVFMVLNASVEVCNASETRMIPIQQLYSGDGLEPFSLNYGDLVVRIHIPEESSNLHVAYRKLRLRNSMDFPSAGVAVAMEPDGRIIHDLRIAVTGVDTRPVSFPRICQEFEGEQLAESISGEITRRILKFIHPVKNVPLAPPYRRHMVGVFIHQIFREWSKNSPAEVFS
jgi:4-hydroxybenzoyl-CoA reductase subunit beta